MELEKGIPWKIYEEREWKQSWYQGFQNNIYVQYLSSFTEFVASPRDTLMYVWKRFDSTYAQKAFIDVSDKCFFTISEIGKSKVINAHL